MSRFLSRPLAVVLVALASASWAQAQTAVSPTPTPVASPASPAVTTPATTPAPVPVPPMAVSPSAGLLLAGADPGFLTPRRGTVSIVGSGVSSARVGDRVLFSASVSEVDLGTPPARMLFIRDADVLGTFTGGPVRTAAPAVMPGRRDPAHGGR